MLPFETFKTIVASTPLISIDLIVRNAQGEILLGKRTNRPAKGYWFVPGGRVLKDESLECAMSRLVKVELNIESSQATFKGVYQHFYDDNFSEDDFTTHYVVIAYELVVDDKLLSLPIEQHSEYKWFSKEELLNSPLVHEHTKWYFQ